MKTYRTFRAAYAAILLTPFVLSSLPSDADAQTAGGPPALPGEPGSGSFGGGPSASNRVALQWVNLVELTRQVCNTESPGTNVYNALGCGSLTAWVDKNQVRGRAGMTGADIDHLPSGTSVCDAIKSANVVDFATPGSFSPVAEELLAACGERVHTARVVARLCKNLEGNKGPEGLAAKLQCNPDFWYVPARKSATPGKSGNITINGGSQLCALSIVNGSDATTKAPKIVATSLRDSYGVLRGACATPPLSLHDEVKVLGAVADICEKTRDPNKQVDELNELAAALKCNERVHPWNTIGKDPSKASGLDLPNQGSLCELILSTGTLEHNPHYKELRTRCDPNALRAAIGTGVAAFVAPILQGAGDFLKDRAKEELLAFAVEQVGKNFCAAGDEWNEGELVKQLEGWGRDEWDWKGQKRKGLDVRTEKEVRSAAEPRMQCNEGKARSGLLMSCSLPYSYQGVAPAASGTGALNAEKYSDAILAARAAENLKNGISLGHWALEVTEDEALSRHFRSKVQLSGSVLFPGTCATLLPNGIEGSPSVDAIHGGELQRVLAGELMTLPIRLLSLDGLPLSNTAASARTAKEEKQIRIMAYHLAKEIVDAVRMKQSAFDFLAALDLDIRNGLAKEGVMPNDCKFEKGVAPAMPCTLGLLFTTASKGKVMISNGKIPAPQLASQWVDAATKQFCKDYGGGTGSTGDCVWSGGPETKLAIWNELRAMTQAIVDFHNSLDAINKQYEGAMFKKPPFVAGAEAAESVAAAIDALIEAMVRLGEAIANDVATTEPGAFQLSAGQTDPRREARQALQKMKQVTALVHEVLKGTSAATRQDYRAVSANINAVLNAELVSPYVSANFKKGASFILALGSAKTREDVRATLEEHASPVGSYRAKYLGTNRWFINGFVGIGGQLNVAVAWPKAASDGKDQAPSLVSASPLTAPIGVDTTVWHGTHNHIGFTFTAIDALGMRVITREGEDDEYDFDGVLAPGAFFRWGMVRSPVVLMVGARWQPLLKSVERNCGGSGNQACWQGPFSLMANIAVDVPLFPLD